MEKYNKKDGTPFSLDLPGGRVINGEFFDGVRLDPASIPSGKKLLHLCHADDDWSAPASVSPNPILVNFCGSFVVSSDVNIDKETDVEDYSY